MSTVAANCALLCVDDVGAVIRVMDDGARSVKVLDVYRITWLELGGLSNCMPSIEIVPLIVSVRSLLLFKEQGKMGVAGLSLLQGRQFGFQLSAHKELAWCKTVLKRCRTVQEQRNVWSVDLRRRFFLQSPLHVMPHRWLEDIWVNL